MSFGSTQSTLEPQIALQLQWDCSQHKGAVRRLVDSWIAAANNRTGQGPQPGPTLNKKEQNTIAEILQMGTLEVTTKIESLLRVDLAHFIRVRNQLLSLLIAWEQAILEKKRYAREGFHVKDGEKKLSPHQFMIVFQTIYFRARVGLTSLPTSTPLSGTPVSMKRSIQSNPSAPPKKARLQNEDKNQVKTCDRNLADISLSNPATTNHHLTRLPIEIRMEILGYLPNLRTLLSAILTHSSLYATYLEYSRSIPLAIFRERCRAIQGCDIGDVFWELVFAINHDFVHRDVVKELFACAWDVFHTRHMEDVLIPLGRALALTYRQDHRGEAVHLLRELANGSEPFPRSELPYPKSFHDDPPCLDVILFPVLSLLKKWEKEEVSDDNRWDEPEDRRISHLQRYMRKSQGEGIYNPFILAYVEDTRFRVVGGNAYHVIAYDGIHFPWRHDHAERKLAEVVVVKRGQALPKDLGRDNRRFR